MSMPSPFPPRLRGLRQWLLAAAVVVLLVAPPVTRAQVGPNLAVTKACAVDGQANGQQSILCTVTVTNIGANASLAPLSIADTATAPAGSTITGAGGSLPISCSPGAGPVLPISCTANVSLQPGQSGTALFSFTVPQGAGFGNCVTVTIPRNAGNPGDLSPANNTDICTSLQGGDNGDDGNGDNGSVTFAKIVVNKTGYPTPRAFDIQYQCQPDMSTVVNVALTAPGYQQSVPVRAGAQCKFTEVAPAAPKGCQWIVTYPNGQYGTAGDRLVVQNELNCGGGGGEDKGEINFVKKILNETGQRVTGPFEIEVKCEPGSSGRVLLAGPGFRGRYAVATNAKCKFQEIMPEAPKGCRWSVNYPSGQVAHAGDTMYVENVLTCDGGGGGPQACRPGSSLVTFPGSDVKYCCDGKPGSDRFCCTRVEPAKPIARKR